MEITKLLKTDENRAVSPVIGVILMVAITVILAAVIGTFVLGLGDQVQQTAPNAQFSWDLDSGELTATHDGGDQLNGNNLEFTGPGVNSGGSSVAWTSAGGSAGSSTVTAGGSATLSSSQYTDDTVRLVWTSEDGGQSSTVAKWEP